MINLWKNMKSTSTVIKIGKATRKVENGVAWSRLVSGDLMLLLARLHML